MRGLPDLSKARYRQGGLSPKYGCDEQSKGFICLGQKVRNEGCLGFLLVWFGLFVCFPFLLSSFFFYFFCVLFFSCKWWILTPCELIFTSLCLLFKHLFQRHNTLQLSSTHLVVPVVFIAVNSCQIFDIKLWNLYLVATSLFLTYFGNLILNHLKSISIGHHKYF